MTKRIIYGLKDPNTLELRYIGMSIKGLSRPKKHFMPSVYNDKRRNSHLYNWIKLVISSNKLPEIIIIEECNEDDNLYEIEQSYIAYFKYIGCKLTNKCDGGAGAPGRKLTQEQKNQISKRHKGKKLSEETKLRISQSLQKEKNPNYGKKYSEEFKKKLSEARKGRKLSDKHKEAISKALKNKTRPKFSEEWISNMRESHKFQAKAVLDDSGNYYISIAEAARSLGVDRASIRHSIAGKMKVKNRKFTYA